MNNMRSTRQKSNQNISNDDADADDDEHND